jgi:ATP-dependent Clp protease ATP-binding subunit ClpA
VLERFSDRARRAVSLAEREARQLGHPHIGSEHLVLGVLAEGDSQAARALVAYGATLDGARSKVAEAVGETSDVSGVDKLGFTDRATRALERASRLSLRRLDPCVDTEHILLSVLDVEGRAGQVLRGLNVDLAGLREAVDATADEPETPVDLTEPLERVEPQCSVCGSALSAALSHRIMTSHPVGREPRDFVVAYCSACGSTFGVL